MDTKQALFHLHLASNTNLSDLTEDQIKRAYRTRAKEFHPDKHATASESKKRHMQREFMQLTEAAEYLRKQAAIDFTMGEINSAKKGTKPASAIDWLDGLGKTLDWLGIKSNEILQSFGESVRADIRGQEKNPPKFSDASSEPIGYTRTGKKPAPEPRRGRKITKL
ncbi:DnaJ domain-containing protein [Patescibacteria group bacterium]|nr:DnaJ domain-containing protein [Patescibacteria group bacterium]MBU1673840.1 DnaJ domain-containing protein [Patescibacteria group bacterium]MBU1963217.1 DnaJ domain-containing protein [Patescibacteria group bacterium]